MRVELQYFKPRGKWYADGGYNTQLEELHDIWHEVSELRETGMLPGLARSTRGHDYHVLINVPGHKHEHPTLLVLRSADADRREEK